MKNTEISLNVTVHYQAHQGVLPWAKTPQQEPTSDYRLSPGHKDIQISKRLMDDFVFYFVIHGDKKLNLGRKKTAQQVVTAAFCFFAGKAQGESTRPMYVLYRGERIDFDAPQLIFAAYMRLINAKRDAYAEARLKILAELVFYARLAAKTHYH